MTGARRLAPDAIRLVSRGFQQRLQCPLGYCGIPLGLDDLPGFHLAHRERRAVARHIVLAGDCMLSLELVLRHQQNLSPPRPDALGAAAGCDHVRRSTRPRDEAGFDRTSGMAFRGRVRRPPGAYAALTWSCSERHPKPAGHAQARNSDLSGFRGKFSDHFWRRPRLGEARNIKNQRAPVNRVPAIGRVRVPAGPISARSRPRYRARCGSSTARRAHRRPGWPASPGG